MNMQNPNLKKIAKIACQIIVVLCLFSTLLLSCTKEVPFSKVETSTFIRTWGDSNYQSGSFLKQIDNGNILLFGVDVNDYDTISYSRISTIDPSGRIVNEKVANGYFNGAFFNPQDDGSFLVGDYGTLFKFSRNGELELEAYTSYGSAFPAQIKSFDALNDNYVMCTTNGKGTGAASTNMMHFVDKNGNTNPNSISFPDSYFGCKVLFFAMYNYSDPNTFYFWGYGFKNWGGSWAEYSRTFFAKITTNAAHTTVLSKKVVFPDSADNRNYNKYLYSVSPSLMVYSDKSIVTSMNLTNNQNGLVHGHFIKMDSNLNLVWEKDMPLEGMNNNVLSMAKTSDGGFIACGNTTTAESKIPVPFYVKFDKNGNEVWQNIIKSKLYGEGWWAIELKEGGYMFTGNSSSFGNGTTNQDIFLMKTNKYGKLD